MTAPTRRGRRWQKRKPGATTARGYGTDHQKLRKRWAPQTDAGLVDCARCGERIEAGQPWDLGHDDEDRGRYRGPEHASCNRATRARRGVDPEPRPTEWW